MKAIQQPGTLTAALNWYRGMPFSSPRETRRKVTVPTMYVWSDDDVAPGDERPKRAGGTHAGGRQPLALSAAERPAIRPNTPPAIKPEPSG